MLPHFHYVNRIPLYYWNSMMSPEFHYITEIPRHHQNYITLLELHYVMLPEFLHNIEHNCTPTRFFYITILLELFYVARSYLNFVMFHFWNSITLPELHDVTGFPLHYIFLLHYGILSCYITKIKLFYLNYQNSIMLQNSITLP